MGGKGRNVYGVKDGEFELFVKDGGELDGNV